MGRMQGRVAFITGAARGQGRSHAVRLAGDGASIIGVDICADIASNGYPMATRDELDETVGLVEAAGGKMLASVADVRDFHQLQMVLDAGVEQFGRLDTVCANAGIATMTFRELTIDEELAQWTDVLDVNLVGAFHTARAAIPPHLQNPLPVDMLEPEDVSAAISYLASDDAKYVTGVTFPVDAGFCNKL